MYALHIIQYNTLLYILDQMAAFGGSQIMIQHVERRLNFLIRSPFGDDVGMVLLAFASISSDVAVRSRHNFLQIFWSYLPIFDVFLVTIRS
jgi:hypothetical protein